MILPEEIVTNRVLPTLRARLAIRLAERGLKERAIAARLGLTQSAVSKYLRGRVRSEPAVGESETFRTLIEVLADGLAENRLSPFEALGRVVETIRREEDRGLICRLHEESMPSLVGLGCDLCVRPGRSARLEEERVLGDLRFAVRMLQAIPGFARLIPNVGSNVARAMPGARSTLEVAAIPGRIFEMRGSVRVPAGPEFGASRHVAEVVLAVGQVHPSLRAALNVRWDDRVMAAVRSLAWTVLEFDAAYEGRAARIAETLRRTRKVPNLVYHRGAFGIEPIAYLVGPDAGAVAKRAETLAETLSGAAADEPAG